MYCSCQSQIRGEGMDAKDAAMAAKRYFEDTKSIRKFIFETVSVKRDSENWIIICLVQDLFDDESHIPQVKPLI